MPHLVVVLPAAQCAQCGQVLVPDLVLVALHEAQQRLVPHHRHLPLVVREPHKVVHLGLCKHSKQQSQGVYAFRYLIPAGQGGLGAIWRSSKRTKRSTWGRKAGWQGSDRVARWCQDVRVTSSQAGVSLVMQVGRPLLLADGNTAHYRGGPWARWAAL